MRIGHFLATGLLLTLSVNPAFSGITGDMVIELNSPATTKDKVKQLTQGSIESYVDLSKSMTLFNGVGSGGSSFGGITGYDIVSLKAGLDNSIQEAKDAADAAAGAASAAQATANLANTKATEDSLLRDYYFGVNIPQKSSSRQAGEWKGHSIACEVRTVKEGIYNIVHLRLRGSEKVNVPKSASVYQRVGAFMAANGRYSDSGTTGWTPWVRIGKVEPGGHAGLSIMAGSHWDITAACKVDSHGNIYPRYICSGCTTF